MDTLGIIAAIIVPAGLVLVLFLFPSPRKPRDHAPTNVERLECWKCRRKLVELDRLYRERESKHHPLTRTTPLNDIERARLKRRAGGK